jgi:hypothetical protein
MIERLVEVLRDLGTSPSAEDIADLVWLAQAMGNPTFVYAKQWAADQAAQADSLTTGDANRQMLPKDEKRLAEDNSNHKEQQGAGVSLPGATQNRPKGRGGYPLRLPGVAALPHARKLGRELRPLKRHLPSRTRFVLDEEATARQSADSNSLQVMRRPATERWLDLALVIDECSSMMLWRQTVAEFIMLLEQLGAFRTIETWYIATDHPDENLALYPTRRALATGIGSRHPRYLVAPQGQRLTLIISDCIGRAWHTGKVARMIAQWKKSNLIGLVQVLPEYLWERTALRQATFVDLQAYSPGLLNEQLVIEWPWYWQSDEHKAAHLPVPIMTLEQDSLAAWASLLTGKGDWVSPGVILPSGDSGVIVNTSPQTEFHTEQLWSNEELLLRFRTSASPQAQKLAGYLAAMDELSLPLIRLVQHIMCDKPTHAQLAEVICSGLLKQTTSYQETLHSDEIRFVFVNGVREWLLNATNQDDIIKVYAIVTDALSVFINRYTGKQIQFEAIVEDPTLLENVTISPSHSSFAQAGVNWLNRLGGRYTDIARKLEKQFQTILPEFGKVSRRSCLDTPVEQQLDRQPELEKIVDLLDKAAANPHSDTKRLIFIEGEAGIGKSWLLCSILEHLQKHQPEWRIASPDSARKVAFDARNFVGPDAYAHCIRLMNECAGQTLLDVTEGQPVTQENVMRCANNLHIALMNITNEPLLLLFDDLEWWMDIDGRQREFLDTLFRTVWRVLLRLHPIPCVIICAGRRAPQFRDVLLKRILHTVKIEGFAANELSKLLLPATPPVLQDLVKAKAAGNPWVAQLLQAIHTHRADALTSPAYREGTLRWLFQQVVEKRFDPALQETLYRLVQKHPNGFEVDDELLPEGDTTIYKLVRTSFVEFDTESRRYQIANVLTNLFKEASS